MSPDLLHEGPDEIEDQQAAEEVDPSRVQEQARQEGERRRMGRDESPAVQRVVCEGCHERTLAPLQLVLLAPELLEMHGRGRGARARAQLRAVRLVESLEDDLHLTLVQIEVGMLEVVFPELTELVC